jgi:glucose/arabinose dehydrogenase
MDLVQILEFLGTHLLVAAVATLVLARRERVALAAALVALAGVAVVTVLLARAKPGASFLPHTLRDMTSPRPFIAVLLGGATALPWLFLLLRPGSKAAGRVLLPIGMVLALGGVVLAGVAYSYASRQPTGAKGAAHDGRFVVERIADSEADPIAVAVDEEDRVFVSLQLTGQEEYAGQVARVEDGSGGGPGRLVIVADSPCLFRPFGLAASRGALYVSRSGFLARAKAGRVEYENSGAVTRLNDLDGDGVMDFYEDVVTGLPGSRGSVTQHQNNGIEFGPDGGLYVACGASSNRDVPDHPWEGSILATSPDFGRVDVYARGFRNPFGLAFGPEGELFCTDNDSWLENPGDELNHVERGAHYGHPYVIGDDDGGGSFRRPIALSRSDSTFTGVAYSDSDGLPAECRGCLYIADFIGNRILRARLSRQGSTYAAEITPFATLPLPIDIAITSRGVLYVTSHVGGIFRIRRKT